MLNSFVAGVCMKSLVESGVHLTVIAGRVGQILRSMMTPAGSAILQSWLEGKGVNVVTKGRIERIEPGPRLVMDKQSFDADLIILATHGRTGLSHVLLGSVAERVVRHAPCPVLVVRDAERDFLPPSANTDPPPADPKTT